MIPLYDFNPSSTKPLVHLAYANGFPPRTYARMLEPLFPNYHAVSLHARPLWENCPPESLSHWSQMGDDLLQGLGEIQAKQVVGIGHSMGGVVTLYAALKRPDLFSRLVLLDPTLLEPGLLWKIRLARFFHLEARNQLIEGALRRRKTWGSVEEAFLYFRARPLFRGWSDQAVQAYAQSLTKPLEGGGVGLVYSPEWEARIYETIPTDVWKLPGRLKCPAMVLRGENSNTFTAKSEAAFRKANPQVSIHVLPGAGHFVPQEKPDEVGKLIADFIGKVGR